MFRQLSQDEQDTIRVLCLESLIPLAEHLTKEENQIHTLGTLLAAGEDKSWKVRLSFARNFAAYAKSFGKDITDNNLVQTFSLLLNDNEAEVKLAAINNAPNCLKYLSHDKIMNIIIPAIEKSYEEGNAQFKAGVAVALGHIVQYIGMSYESGSKEPFKVLEEILKALLSESNNVVISSSDVRLNAIDAIPNFA